MNPPPSLRPIARRALAAQSDERLVRLVRDGHEPAFEETVRRYRGPLVAFAAAIVSADGAEDVVQTSLEKAHRALLADAREINLRPWLFAIVRNGALNAIRGEPRVDELDEAMTATAGTSELAEQRDDLDRLVVAMCALPEAQRRALVKRELEGEGHGEIAAQLGTTATAVRGLIFRARVGLRDALGAVVPLPILRALLSEGPAIGLAGGGAGAGATLIGGGAGAKGGAAIATAIVALGTGIAIEGGRNDETRRPVAQASEGGDGAAGRDGREGSPAAPGSVSSGGPGESGGGPSSGEGGEGGSGDAAGPAARSGGEGDDSGPSEDSGPGSDDSEGHEPDDESDGPDEEGGHSGSGGPNPDDLDPEDGPEPDDFDDTDDSGPGGGSSGSSGPGGGGSSGSGSGSGSGGSSGPGGGSIPPPPEPDDDPPEIDSSGSGSSGSGSSGSGSSGSGSGSSGSGSGPDVEID